MLTVFVETPTDEDANPAIGETDSQLKMAWQFFRRQRCWLAQAMCQVVYEWFLTEAVATGRIDATGFFDDPVIRQAYCRACWEIQADPHCAFATTGDSCRL